MNWWPDSNWLKVLDINGSSAAAIATASVSVLLLAEGNLFYLSILPMWVRTVFVIIALFSSAILLAKIWDCFQSRLIEGWRQRQATAERKNQKMIEEQKRFSQERETLRYLDTLNHDEREILSYLLQKKQQSFQGYLDGERASTLIQKQLIIPGRGFHDLSEWPFLIPNFVWVELEKRQDDFNTANLHGPEPWRNETARERV